MTINLRCLANLILSGILLFLYGFMPTAQGFGLGSIVVYNPGLHGTHEAYFQEVDGQYVKSTKDADLKKLSRQTEMLSENVKNGIYSWYGSLPDNELQKDQSIAKDIASSLRSGISEHVNVTE